MDTWTTEHWRGHQALAQLQPRWDELHGRSQARDLVFLTGAWLRASAQAYARGPRRPLLTAVTHQGRWIAAAAWTCHRGVARLLGTGPGDSLDLLLDRALTGDQRQRCARLLLEALRQHSPGFRAAVLRNVPVDQHTPALLEALPGWHTARLRRSSLPGLWTQEADARLLGSKSLRRNARHLARGASLRTEALDDPQQISARLELLFDLHQERWADTPTPSMFQHAAHRAFFRALAHHGGQAGWLRWIALWRDQRCIAAHLGTHFAGRYLWYKPAFSLDWSKHSPGMVLLREGAQQARLEGAAELDMGLGEEGYKERLATHHREVVDLYLTPWAALALRQRARRGVRALGRRALDGLTCGR